MVHVYISCVGKTGPPTPLQGVGQRVASEAPLPYSLESAPTLQAIPAEW